MIIINYDLTVHHLRNDANMTSSFYSWDDGDVHTMLQPHIRVPGVQGTLAVCNNVHDYDFNEFKNADDRVRVVVALDYISEHHLNFEEVTDQCRGWVLKNDKWIGDAVQCVSINQQLFSRFGGIVESDVIAGKKGDCSVNTGKF